MKRPTMDDVAREAGVSQATVSMVLNGADAGRVAGETAARVRDTARRLGYRTNMHAKVLREGKTRLIGLVGAEVATSPFAGEMILGAQHRAWDAGHVLLTVDTTGDERLQRAAVDMLQSYQVAGVVFSAMYHQIVQVPKAVRGLPTVCLNCQDESGVVPSVFPDEERGGREAARVLLDAGHRRIAMINIGPQGSTLSAAAGRLAGFTAAVAEAGVPLAPDLVRYAHGTYDQGLRLAGELMALPEPPTAIFCANDRTALGAYHCLQRLGLGIPDDVSIVGFDDQRILADVFDPPITTFRLPLEEMGKTAVDLLLGPEDAPLRTPLTCTLVERDSVAPPRR